MRILSVSIIIGATALLTACNIEGPGKVTKDSPASSHPTAIEIHVPGGIRTFVVEADGIQYRCFDTGSYSGGLWCTQKP